MTNKRKNGFTLVELVVVLVIMTIMALIVTPLILTVINKAKASANKRSVDAYGKAVSLSVLSYLMDNGKYPTDLSALSVEYTGKEVSCNVMSLNSDGSIYLSECSVGGTEVKDDKSEDGWYHYGKTNLATLILLNKANDISVTTYEAGSDESHQMYTFTHDATDQTEALTDYRYIGSDPYNYVTFNNETWRIIGVFTVEDENGNKKQRMKIIRDESIGNYAWNSNNVNEWSTSSLNVYLNGDYYDSLSNDAQLMIASTKFYLGGSNTGKNLGGPDYYTFERGETVYSGRSTNWTGNIGLMYPSDYVYTFAFGVDDICYTDGYNCDESTSSNGWLYNFSTQWTLSPCADASNNAFRLIDDGDLSILNVGYSYDVRPTLYLSSDVQIASGNGSQEFPYQLSL